MGLADRRCATCGIDTTTIPVYYCLGTDRLDCEPCHLAAAGRADGAPADG